MKLKLPHFPRIITAVVLPGAATLALWVLFIGIVSLNIMLTKTKQVDYSGELFDVLARPFTSLTHERLALALWNIGARTTAKRELLIAAELVPPEKPAASQVLGVTTIPVNLLQTWENAPKREAAQLKYWQDVAANHPDYRDAYIQLATLAYTQGNLVQTKTFLAQAAALDPNSKAVNDLLGFITKKLER